MSTQLVADLTQLTSYVRGLITGDRPRLDIIDTRAMEALRRRPLADFLTELDAEGLRIRGARGNEVADILALLATVMTQSDISKSELSRRSGVSRGHIIDLFRGDDSPPRPTLETTLRLAYGLEYPLSVADVEDADDDVEVSPAPSPSPSSTREEPRPPEPTYRQGLLRGGLLGAAATAVVGLFLYLGRRTSTKGAA